MPAYSCSPVWVAGDRSSRRHGKVRFDLGEEDLKEGEEKKEEEQQQHGVQETPSNRMKLAIDNLEALEQVRIVFHIKHFLFLCLLCDNHRFTQHNFLMHSLV